jgi:hypothetical protein
MRSCLPLLAALAALALPSLALPGPALAEPPPAPPGPLGERILVVANRAGLAISELFVSPTSSDAWGEDRLGDDLLRPGRAMRLRLGRVRDCAFDVLAIYEDSSREERPALNLCRVRTLALDGSARLHPAELPLHEVVLSNQSGRPIQQVYVSAIDAPAWGEDLLLRSISVGGQGTVAFRGDCTVDIRIVFENRAAEERRGVDLCRQTSLSIEPGWTTSDDLPAPPA